MNMKRFLLLLLVLALALPLTACQPSSDSADAPAPASGGVVNVFNWEDYIDPAVIELFEEQTGITVNYMCFTTVEDMIVQVEANPGAFDVCFPSDYIIERMKNKGMLSEINFANIPNADPANPETCQTDPYLLKPDYDPDNKYSVPYMWGTVGVLYNVEMMEKLVPEFDPENTSWSILWDERLMSNVIMMDSIRDSMGVTLKYLGYSANSTVIPELFAARDKLIEQKKLGVVKAYQVDETKDKMAAGEAAMAVMWSGDALYAIDKAGDDVELGYFIPVEGSNVWCDAAVIPTTAKNKENAEKFINFLCDPEIAALNWNYIWYSSPNMGAIELIEAGSEELELEAYEYREDTALYPTEEIKNKCEFFRDIPENYLSVYEALWMDLKNTK
ncbi:MAG: ABC transporter substrate-binding protein [Clostridia bacterium]|nr:ABC transporter substrate-binding protein [Clostridia bacterium]